MIAPGRGRAARARPATARCGRRRASAFDFLVDVAAELPMQMICILLGVPESERHWLFEAIEPQLRLRRLPQGVHRAAVGRGGRLADVRLRPGADRGEAGRADRRHAVGRRERDAGRRRRRLCSEIELYLFFSLLFSAGAETTRNAVAGGLLALVEHPDQLAGAACRSGAAADRRSRRWCAGRRRRRRSGAPRPATSSWAAAQIEAGQKVLIWEGSANRDALVFDDPDTLRHRA